MKLATYSLILTLLYLLSACDNQEKKLVQTLARVNGEDITILQFNDELAHSNIDSADNEKFSKLILDKLIDRQLLAEEGMKDRINRSPEVIQAIEREKTRIIEQAYLKNIVSKAAPPTENEIATYYDRHPEFFSSRKFFYIQQISIPANVMNDDLKILLNKIHSLDHVITWLNNHGISYSEQYISRSTMDFPDSVATMLNTMKTGQIFLYQDGNRSLINQISNIKQAPVSLHEASPHIRQTLIRQSSGKSIEAEVTRLRNQAKISYFNLPASITQ